MIDPIGKLEQELAAMRPRRISPSLAERITAELDAASRTQLASRAADRALLCTIVAGALAACVILSLSLRPGSEPWPESVPVASSSDFDRSVRLPLAWAQTDPNWIDTVK